MRLRDAVGPFHGGDNCTGNSEDWRDCNIHHCPGIGVHYIDLVANDLEANIVIFYHLQKLHPYLPYWLVLHNVVMHLKQILKTDKVLS